VLQSVHVLTGFVLASVALQYGKRAALGAPSTTYSSSAQFATFRVPQQSLTLAPKTCVSINHLIGTYILQMRDKLPQGVRMP
jgi:hypothetical protein